jgi:hypothetical protein
VGRGAVLLFALGALLAACTSNPVPEGYRGPTARVADSWVGRGDHSADFFYVAAIDGRQIQNDLSFTEGANYGNGFSLTPFSYDRNVPAQAAAFTIVGRTHYAAPLLEMVNRVYEVRGEVHFAPEPNHSYIVTGKLGDGYSAVWIEDATTGQPVTARVEIKGSAALGLLEK